MRLSKHLANLERRHPVARRPELADGVHWAGSAELPVHRWFRYREGYSPSLFNHLPSSKERLDPFCGCGTTLLTSASSGIRSYGVDLSPLATFVANVKTRRYTTNDKRLFSQSFRASIPEHRSIKPAECPEYSLLPKLFQSESLESLLRIKAFYSQIPNEKIRGLMKLAWLSIIEDSSNVFKEGNGLKYRNKLRRPTKYVTVPDRVWIPKYFGESIPEFVLSLWSEKCGQIEADLDTLIGKKFAEPKIRTDSCMNAASVDFGKKFDLVVFSPPYANRFDYFEAFKMELWLGDFVKSSADMRQLRSGSMRSNLSAKAEDDASNWGPLHPFLAAMDPESSSVRMGIKETLQGYFADVRTLLRNIRPVLARKSEVVIVVGNSAYAKSIVPTDLLTASVAREEGFKVKSIAVARPLHVSSQQRKSLEHLQQFMRESVIVLSP